MAGAICGDNMLEIIERVQKHLLEATNLKEDSEEYRQSYSLLFRLWQLGYLK